MRIVWNPVARKNLQTIQDHYQQFSKRTAKEVVREIIFATRRLEDFPKSGRIVPEISDPDFREVISNNWRIIYMMPAENEEFIEVLNIIHSAQQFGSRK